MNLVDILSNILNILYLVIPICMLFRRKKLGKNIIIMITAMFLTFAVETYAAIMLEIDPSSFVLPFYVIVILGLVYSLFFTYFLSLTEDKTLRKIQIGIFIAFLINYVVSAVVNDSFFKVFPHVTNFISIILILFSVVIFFRDIFDSDRILHIKNYYPFWVGVSLIVVYLGILPIVFFGAREITPVNDEVFRIVLNCVNILGYSVMLFTIFFAKDIEKKN